MTDEQKLMKAALSAAATLDAIYQWVDRVEAAGGATTISGIAECHAMLASLHKNRARMHKLVMEPLAALIEEAE